MRKALLFLGLAVGALAVQARSLTPAEALARLNADGPRAAAAAGGTAQARLVETAKVDGAPVYYVYANKSATLFVSADDVAQPLLGYVENPDLDMAAMPPAMKWWLGEYAREIAWARENPAEAAALDITFANAPERATMQDISTLVKARWDQDAPYYNMCPTYNGERCVTGCVATAIAQVMHFHKYPAAPKGSTSYYWSTGRKNLSIDYTTLTFDWDNMPNTYGSSYTTAQANAVATLMKAVGYGVKMNYNTASSEGSGAYMADIAPAMKSYFDYSAQYYDKADYSNSNWSTLVYNELAAGRPIVYGGSGSGGGHCFVCDGYQASTGKFHFNWGWSGSYDGYFALTSLNPGGSGIGGGTGGGFSSYQDAVFVNPNGSGSEDTGAFSVAKPSSISALVAGDPYTIKATVSSTYTNSHSVTITPYLCVIDNNQYLIKAELDALTVTVPGAGTVNATFSGTLEPSLAAGSYYLVFADPDMNLISPATEVTVAEGANSGSVDVVSIECSTGYVVDQTASVKVNFKNTFNTSKTVDAILYICTVTDGQYSAEQQIGSNVNVTVPANGTKSTTFSGKITVAAGDYELAVVSGGYIIYAEPITVTTAGGGGGGTTDAGSVTVADVVIAQEIIKGKAISAKVTFVNTADQDAVLAPALFIGDRTDTGYSGYSCGTGAQITVPAHGALTTTVSGTVTSNSDLAAGFHLVLVAATIDGSLTVINRPDSYYISASAYNEPILTSVVTDAQLVPGQAVNVTATFYNPSTSVFKDKLEMWLAPASGSCSTYSATTTETIPAKGYLIKTFAMTVSSSYSAGTYYLQAINEYTSGTETKYAIIGDRKYPVRVVAAPTYSVSDFKAANADEVEELHMSFNLKVASAANLSALFVAPVYDADDNCMGILVFEPTTFTKGTTQTVTHVGKLEGLPQAQTYTAELHQVVTDGHSLKLAETQFTVKDLSAIDNAEVAESDVEEIYFNLQGVRMDRENLTPGLYIKVAGHNVTKVIIK